MNKKNILIICWDFPPHNSIGGRRWAKIAKSLCNMNYNVSALSSSITDNSQKILWISKEDLSRIKLFFLPNHPLVSWLNNYSSPLKILKIRLAELLLKIFYKGTIFDKAIGIESKFTAYVEQIIKDQSISAIFVTGAPFNLLYYTARLKEKFPGIKIVADYRDPWINAQNYGMQNLSAKRKNDELQKQNYVFENVDYVTAPNSFLLQEIKNTYTGKQSSIASFIELPHAFDQDDVINVETTSLKSEKIKIIYAGTLYLGIDKYLTFLNESINYIKNKQTAPETKIYFYTNEQEKKKLFTNNKEIIQFSGSVGDKIFCEATQTDYIIIMLSEHNKNYLTSKFFEFLPYKKPYLYIGPEGFVSKKIEDEGLGFYLKSIEDLYKVITGQKKINLSKTVDIQKYSFNVITKEFLTNIKIEK